MKIWLRITIVTTCAALATWLTLIIPNPAHAQPAAAAKGNGKGKGGSFAQDPRAQARTYHFEDTNQDLACPAFT